MMNLITIFLAKCLCALPFHKIQCAFETFVKQCTNEYTYYITTSYYVVVWMVLFESINRVYATQRCGWIITIIIVMSFFFLINKQSEPWVLLISIQFECPSATVVLLRYLSFSSVNASTFKWDDSVVT